MTDSVLNEDAIKWVRDYTPYSLPYSRQQITEDDIAAVVEVLRSPWLTQGPKVEEFEEALCRYTGAKYAVAVSNGTAALHLAYMAVGVRETCGIATSPLSFVATANAALLLGAPVEFVDVDPATGNATVRGSSFLVPVHYAGRAAPMLRYQDGSMAANRTIEDACHALGAMDFDGCSRIGSCAHSLATVFSFHPVKSITTGEGGAITTNDHNLSGELRRLRAHGRYVGGGDMVSLGLNGRMTDMQAALGISQLNRLDENLKRRREIAGAYSRAEATDEEYGNLFGLTTYYSDGTVRETPAKLVRPHWPRFDGMGECGKGRHAWHLYPVRIKNGRRDEVKAKLNAQGIGAQVHYSPIIPLQPYYRERFGYKPGDFPNAEAWAAEELSLPLYPQMTTADVERVVDALKEALA